jgi:hypothetical protein
MNERRHSSKIHRVAGMPMNEIGIDLPATLPLGIRFWQRLFDMVAELTNGKFTLPLLEALEQKLSVITEHAERDPEFKKVLRATPARDVCFKLCEQIALAVLRKAPDPENQREGAKLLLSILAKKQNVAAQ